MKKIAVKLRKYINRISVLVTVFAVLMTASFYNPASLASFSDNVADFPWRIVSPSLSGSWIVWNPSEKNFGDRVSGASARGVYRSSGIYSPPNVSPAQSMVSVDFSLPFFLWPLPERTPSETFTVDGKFNVAVLIRLDSSVGSTSVFCNPISVDGLLPDGVSISFFQTSGGFTLNSANVISLNFQVVFDNVEFGPARDHLSFTLDFPGSYFTNSDSTVVVAPMAVYEFCVQDASLSVRTGYAQGSDRDVVDGYNASKGNASQSKLDTSLSQSEAKQDSLFTSASDTLSDFSLSDISTMPKVVSALSFVSSTMTSIYTALGGINGVGIVLSVGCSILFVSLAVGAYKFYSSHKD